MAPRTCSSRAGGEDGFTLIELVVVVLILGVLAAIALPSFAGHRDAGWEVTVQSDLRNTAAVVEDYFAVHGAYPAERTYTVAAADLGGGARLRLSPGTQVALVHLPGSAFCLEGRHSGVPAERYSYSSQEGRVLSDVACP